MTQVLEKEANVTGPAGSTELVLATAIYGEEYIPFLAPHLFTAQRCNAGAEELVLWRDIPEHIVSFMSLAFPRSKFVRMEDEITGDAYQRIGRKLHCWREACKRYPMQPICLIDCDTVFVRPVDAFIPRDCDVVFTWKEERFPLNTGVVLIRNGATGEVFLEEWARRSERIVRDRAALTEACAVSGAADQHALREMIGFDDYAGKRVCKAGGREFVVRGVECRLLNETNSVPISEDTHVIHYKGGWQPILLRGEGFSANRPADKCREMYDFWLRSCEAADRAGARNAVIGAAAKQVSAFRKLSGDYEARGILHSEMLAVCAVCDALDVEVIIESGRARGQSTYTLARYFAGQGVRIISIDRRGDDYYSEEDDVFARERLAGQEHVDVRYGDGCKVVPELVEANVGRRVAVLLDGPKGEVAVELAERLLERSGDVVAVFLHDTMKGTPQRERLERTCSRIFFSDDEEYVGAHGDLDAPCVEAGQWRPYWNRSYGKIESYGPTLAVAFPTNRIGQWRGDTYAQPRAV